MSSNQSSVIIKMSFVVNKSLMVIRSIVIRQFSFFPDTVHRDRSKSGFSVMEVIVGIMIISIAFVGFMYALAGIRSQSATVEITMKATTLANSVMSQIRAHDFDEKATPPYTAIANLGPDVGETSASLYDDVDDYHLYSPSVSGYAYYAVMCSVYYVQPDSTLNLSGSWLQSYTVRTTPFKLITVNVNHDGLKNPMVMKSLVTPHDTPWFIDPSFYDNW